MKNEKIKWELVVVFFIFISYSIWAFFVYKRHIPFFDLIDEWSVFYYETFIGGFFVSIATFILVLILCVLFIVAVILLFLGCKETYKAGSYGLKYGAKNVKEKIKGIREAKNTREEGSNNSKGMGDSERNL